MPEVIIEPTPLVWMGSYDELPEGPWEVGYAFYWHGFGALSPHYRNNVASVRPPIVVMCPAWLKDDGTLQGTPFCIDNSPTSDLNAHWEVTVDMNSLVIGQKPFITVHPSIHLVGIWHGWLQEGVLHQ